MPSPVLVVGGGPSGLTAALSLAQHGVPVRIIDKADAFNVESRAHALQPRTLEVFIFLGVHRDVLNLSRTVPPMREYKLPGGTEVARTWKILEKLEPSPGRPLREALSLGQCFTESILRDHLGRYGVQVELGTELVDIQQGTETVTATVKRHRQGGSEEIEDIQAAYIIGGDGGKGRTRKLIGATFEGQTKDSDGQVFTDVKIEGLSIHYWHIWSGPGKFTILARPVSDAGSTFNVSVIGQNFDPVDLLDRQKFKEFFHKKSGRLDLVFKDMKSLSYWKPNMRVVNKLSEGRVFLVGDAAHIHSNAGGQGMNASIQDSFNLAWKVALAYKGQAAEDLLSTYHIERLPVVAQILAANSHLYTHLVQKKSSDVEIEATPRANKDGFLRWRNDALFQLDVNYRWSPIVMDEPARDKKDEDDLKARAYQGYPGEGVRAGDRAPDAPALLRTDGTETSLFSIFKPYIHTALAFSPCGVDTAAALGLTETYSADILQVVRLKRHGVVGPVEAGNDTSTCYDPNGTALVASSQTGSTTSEVQEVTAYGVASVFTPSRNRKKGYARHMMRLLHWVLARRSALPPTFPKEWGTPPDQKMLQSAGVANAQFSVLYSDIGSEFYRSSGLDALSHNGWCVAGSTETSWTFDTEASPSSPPQSSDATTPSHNVKHLTQDEVTALYDYDADWIRDDLSRPSATGSDASQALRATRFTFLPHKGVGGFNISRTVQFAPDLQPLMPLSRWGVVVLPQSVSTLPDALASYGPDFEAKAAKALSFVSWTFDTGRKQKTLVVTRLRADEDTFPLLLEEMKAVAREEKVRKIGFWYLHPQLRSIAEAKGWKTAEREDHLSAVKWYGDEREEELEWVYNEKFCWC
ncbi:hypothetical protein GSI_10744 [Ganoderma sinense ZZ0214-1]|uniref:Uncharacterized protein n=1 Tax=Ganoderma sinense ZZ0214-1 TaxID=1077348 RepID=A0A2G8S1E1_9APHY|nr:hypothetical protein GSI_10744 [Ganoderma sinense ZZ0214-1]